MGDTLKKTCRWGVHFRNAFQMGHTRKSCEKLVRSTLSFQNTFTWAIPIKSVFRWVVPLQNIFQMSGTFAKNVCRYVIPFKNISRWVVCSHEMFPDGWYLYKMCFQMGGTFTKYVQMGGTLQSLQSLQLLHTRPLHFTRPPQHRGGNGPSKGPTSQANKRHKQHLRAAHTPNSKQFSASGD